ncbi:MAG: 4-(cytidine 5'-diphospho)-2-C-methyl-D-erythritol kinase [Chlorobi bacterium]|nr:4-(cytidine 5'-diphospho)-2-C-methyl-D-erythritol kinase [Chlorobiota bacterium]
MLERRAYAKINIGLHVLSKRADGYHSIATIFAPLELHDEIRFARADDTTVTVYPPVEFDQADNLAYRAAMLLSRASRASCGAKITIIKHIPLGAGLGGGSSDAAVTLDALNTLWGCHLSQSELAELACQLGSDVPFFLQPSLTYAEGRGDILTPLPPMQQQHVLLVAPGFPISTAWAYGQLSRYQPIQHDRPLADIFTIGKFSNDFLHAACTNDFEPIVFERFPELEVIKHTLIKCGARHASLTGTGSVLYGFFESRDDALIAAARFPRYRTFVTRTLAFS